MVLRLNRNLTIENLGHFPDENVERLRGLLAAGAVARADEHRVNFYEIENGKHVFWIHVSPVNGHVVLLAVWDKPTVTTTTRAA
ncbi:MAG TPA: hypothetical protein VNL38_04080 [Candidatus Nitrosotenuis sp.]|nr:hypothetical protein [Candidatus Nitrosotenuis sp.]